MKLFALYQVEYREGKYEEILVENKLDIEEFVRENEIDNDEKEVLNNLRVGQEVHYGGGACVHSFVRRTL